MAWGMGKPQHSQAAIVAAAYSIVAKPARCFPAAIPVPGTKRILHNVTLDMTNSLQHSKVYIA